jgi:uncharacterized protein (DUF2141 family)
MAIPVKALLRSGLVAAAIVAGVGGDARAEDTKVSLSVSVAGFRGDKGQAIVALFSSKDGWLKLDRAVQVRKVKISGGRVEVKLDGVAPGTYAVSVIHDENENGKLDMRYFPIPGPAEGAGVSNDASATIGPPSYSDAAFRLSDKGGSIKIKVRY